MVAISTENNRCSASNPLSSETRDSNIKSWPDSISAAEIPWFYWQILPDEDPHEDWDYKVDISDVNGDARKDAAANTASYESALDFLEWLL